MRAAALVLLLVVVAGCAHRGNPTPAEQGMPDDFAGTVAYENGSVPPPYHYRWTVTVDDTSATIEWRPGYEEDAESWRETVEVTDDQRADLYEKLSTLHVFETAVAADEGMVGGPGGHYEVTARGKTYDPGSLGGSEDSARLLENVADAFLELVPDDVFRGLKAKQDDWSARQPK